MEEFTDDDQCFVCSQANPVGLRIDFHEPERGPGAEGEVVFPEHLQGWRHTVHGGLLATVLDDAMFHAAEAAGIKCVTGELTVKYRKPAATGVPYRVSAQVLESHGRMVRTEGVLSDAAGEVYAQAAGKMVKIP
jgi:uncharacterized protein (TIGR00369 family)